MFGSMPSVPLGCRHTKAKSGGATTLSQAGSFGSNLFWGRLPHPQQSHWWKGGMLRLLGPWCPEEGSGKGPGQQGNALVLLELALMLRRLMQPLMTPSHYLLVLMSHLTAVQMCPVQTLGQLYF